MAAPLTAEKLLGAIQGAGARVVEVDGWRTRNRNHKGAWGPAHGRTFAEIGTRATQLANALRDELGVDGDQRVATLMWNNAVHVEAYLAIPSMGAVLHTL
ncbi:AMP-binding protein, partial [Streptomyces halstedii]|uniref:AMP-binding protein n=1 Tax=Streptomyces halstedii TaxID=1944 RepID=UPI0033B61C9B